ncbi:hypothetical protein ACGC1H_002425 [Rhizoctonia solani]|uniref:CHAT domain-containing protein n=1 Tax=Rhizoctonia solani TaxID=456999 RepID=A0A8H3CFC9_9AGAM|nr:unnamed protein product [Rhizoctonia solani]
MQRESDRLRIERKSLSISHALTLTPDDHPRMPFLLTNLSLCHSERFELLNELDDLDKAIELAVITLTLTPDDDPRLPQLLADLGALYFKRFQRLGSMNDLEKAIEHAAPALDLTPDEHPTLLPRLANLGVFFLGRFRHLGERDDLETAIEYGSRAVALTPEGHPHLPGWLTNLGNMYHDLYADLGELDGLDKVIQCKTRAYQLSVEEDSDPASQLDSLGACHNRRFNRLGELGDLDKVIEYQSRALNLTLISHPNYPSRLVTLGNSYQTRFMRLGELHDLEKALEHNANAVALTPDGDPELPDRVASLGNSHRHRFLCLGELDDLGKAIELSSLALALTPDGHPSLPDRLASLGLDCLHRFESQGGLDDLAKAIEYQSQALSLTAHTDASLPNLLINLGVAHSIRYERQNTVTDLKQSIEYTSRALDLTPNEHPQLTWRRHSLAKLYFFEAHLPTGNCSDVRYSLALFRQSQESPGSPRDKFKFALEWVVLASKCNYLNLCEAYQTTIDLLPQFIWLGGTTSQRYEDLLKAETLAVDAAVAAIHFLDYRLALEWLENARCVVWKQSVMLRLPLDQLRSCHPNLAQRLQIVARQLQAAGTGSRESHKLPHNPLIQEQHAQKHRRLAEEYNELVSQAHKLPGFETFLHPLKVNKLICAARTGPIVIINCHECRCDALLILPGQDTINHIPLPNFTGEKARKARFKMESSLRRKGIRERGVKILQELGCSHDLIEGVLEMLWNDVVKPVLNYLGYTNSVPTESLPHITWCPTGVISFLPLHAAGDYSKPRSRVFDYAISSYTPTLTALLASTPTSQSNRPQVLAVGLGSTPNHAPLPGTTEELASIKAHIQHAAEYTQLINDQATTAVVLDAMEQHEWVHLACHAHQNVADPTKSGFFLHDGTLDLVSIGRRSFKNKGLAFLSACQTATGDERLPDEAIHLASGLLMAGYPSVIATMWSVADNDAPFVADKVYGQLMKGCSLGNGEAGKALHNAVAELRDRVGEREFGRWVPYIHIGS